MTPLSATGSDDSENLVPSEEELTAPPIVQSADSEDVVPPEKKLTAPPAVLSTEENEAEQAIQVPVSHWLVVAKNQRVNKAWEALLLRAPENARRCYEDLCTAPMVRKPGRVFPLRGKPYSGGWEYEVTRGDRVFYVPNEEKRKVIVYYAGAHLKPAPTPPR